MSVYMKFAILTHPLHGNYGGMLQAYALQSTVSRYGHDIPIIDYETNKLPSTPLRKLKYSLYDCLWHLGISYPNGRAPSNLFSSIAHNFRSKHTSSLLFNSVTNWDEYRLIIGSDQVWRGVYAHHIANLPFFFGDFISSEARAESFVYAASFGTDRWEGTPEETRICADLIKQYKAVSVRENSGINICKEQFHTEAVQMPDPTFLLSNEDYGRLIASEKTHRPSTKYVAAYILDSSETITDTLEFLSEKTHLPVCSMMPQATATKYSSKVPCSVAEWLRCIRDCEYLITDSFHGCVFAIIFNKPFVCLGNSFRGTARFNALLKTYQLKNRVCTSPNDIVKTLLRPIDWDTVNKIREKERDRGLQFLSKNLPAPFSEESQPH